MKKRVVYWGAPALMATLWVVSCKNDDNNTTPQTNQTIQLTATLNGQSVRPTSTGSIATGFFTGRIDPNTRLLTYTLTYSTGLVPTSAYLYRITNTVDSTGVADIALISGLSSGTSTNPGSGTITDPGSGTSTTPGSGTSTTPGSGTSTTPGSGTSTIPGSGTSTGTGSTTVTSPYSGTVSLTQAKIDSIRNGYYYISIGTNSYPNGEIRGRVRAQ